MPLTKAGNMEDYMTAYIFDIDGTLWDTTTIVSYAWNDALKHMNIIPNINISTLYLKQVFGLPMERIFKQLFPSLPQNLLSNVISICRTYEKKYLLHSKTSLLYPKTKLTLKKLSQKNILFIVSNCSIGYIELFLKINSLEEYITDYECYGNTHQEKGENIKILMARNNIVQACYIGDTQMDYIAAKHANIPFIYAKYGFGSVSGFDAQISNIYDLTKLTIL